MSPAQTDGFIDDDEETCPLCITEFDLGDKNFKPCPCGYQICQFCYNTLTTINEKGSCPNCRRVYDEKTIEWKIPSAEEVKADQANKSKKEAAKKRKEAEKREVDASSRKNLAGVRVKQKNLVYVIGICPTIKDENQILETLRSDTHFGQYGEIEKIVVSKAKVGPPQNQGIGVYVTYKTKEAAALCIAQVDGSVNGDKVLRAQYGTTKYCSAFLRHETCNNKNCSFLHETGEENDDAARQDNTSTSSYIPSRPHLTNPVAHASNTQGRPAQPQGQSGAPISQTLPRQGSKDETNSRNGGTDVAALPATANWANKDAHVGRTRRASQVANRSTPSPKVVPSTIAPPKGEDPNREPPKKEESGVSSQTAEAGPSDTSAPSLTSAQASSRKASPSPSNPTNPILDDLIASATSPEFCFVFDDSAFSKEDLEAISRYPSLIDPYGGAKRRLMRDKEEAERAKVEAETSEKDLVPSASAAEEENLESGSLQLGGEPEESHSSRGANLRSGGFAQSPAAIQRPSQQGVSNASMVDNFANLNLNSRSLTPQQRQQLMLLSSGNTQAAHGLVNQLQQPNFGSTAFDLSEQNRVGVFGNQGSQAGGPQTHTRQTSRYSFANDHAKATANNRFTGQQTPSLPGAGAGAGHAGSHFHSAVQGPPPGLKTAGTPPISGGGMFAQGHGFGSNMNAGVGLGNNKDAEFLMRGRSGTSGAGGAQARDISKREYISPTFHSPPLSAPAPGLLGSLYSAYGPYHDPTLVKQKKKGKKHRHANTSSGGGGVVDLADPTILASMHQGATGAGQGLFGNQSQDAQNFPPLEPSTKPVFSQAAKLPFHVNRLSQDSHPRSTTPAVPPGLSLPHAHPSPTTSQAVARPIGSGSQKSSGAVTPAIPVFPIGLPGLSVTQRPKVIDTSQTDGAYGSVDSKGEGSVDSFRPDAVSLGSPKPKGAVVSRSHTEIDASTPALPMSRARLATDAEDGKPTGEKLHRHAPNKLNIAAAQQVLPTEPNPEKAAADIQPPSVVATPSAIGSRPNTPATGVSRTSDTSGRPKVLRLTTNSIPKVESASSVPASATSTIANGPGRQRSRRLSLSSAMSHSRPSSPAGEDRSLVSDSETKTSADVSRTASPKPGSIVGSAPSKTKSKSQLKKERKAKAKDEAEDPAPQTKEVPEEKPEIAPIISRQKKKKRTKTSTVDDAASESTGIPSPGAKEAKTADVPTKPAKEGAKKTITSQEADAKQTAAESQAAEAGNQENAASRAREQAEKPPATVQASETDKAATSASSRNMKLRKTLAELYQDVEADGKTDAMARCLSERMTPPEELLARWIADGTIDPKLFKPQSFSSYGLPRGDNTVTSVTHDGFDTNRRFARISEKQKKKLIHHGDPVRLYDPANSENLLRRLLLTPAGGVIRHLSKEDEEAYVAWEKSLLEAEKNASAASFSKWDRSPFLEEDILNLQGSLADLLTNPKKFGIQWVPDGEAGDDTSASVSHKSGADDEEDGDETDSRNGEDDEDEDNLEENLGLAARAAMTSFYNMSPAGVSDATGAAVDGAADHRLADQPDLGAMDIDALMARIQETAKELETHVKGVKGLEQKAGKGVKGLEKWVEGVVKLAEGLGER